jgi:hypothetical protein
MPTDRRGFWRQFKLGFMFAPLACQAIRDLNVLVFGRVAQHLETRVLGRELLIVSQNGLLADIRRTSRHEAHRILRPDVHQSFVLGARKFNVYLVQLFDGRQVRLVRLPLLKRAHSASVEVADAEARDKHKNGDEKSTSHRASLALALATSRERLSTANRLQ